MGGLLSSMFGWLFGKDSKVDVLPVEIGPESDVPDPKSSMTPRQVAYVTTTWNLFRPNLKANGVKFYSVLFVTHPILQTRFKDFKGVPINDLIISQKLKAHVTTVMTALDSYITNLDDFTTVVQMLHVSGVNHNNRGVQKSDFELWAAEFVKFLGESLGSSWSPAAEDAWKQLLKVFLSQIFTAYKSYDNES